MRLKFSPWDNINLHPVRTDRQHVNGGGGGGLLGLGGVLRLAAGYVRAVFVVEREPEELAAGGRS